MNMLVRRTPDQLQQDYFCLEQRTEKLLLITPALWELLEAKTDLEEHALESKVAEIDLRDGERDGELDQRFKQPVFDCPNCGRKPIAANRYVLSESVTRTVAGWNTTKVQWIPISGRIPAIKTRRSGVGFSTE